MPKRVISGQLPADKLDRFETYQDEHDLSQSEAVRRLTTAGLDAVDDETDTITDRLTSALAVTLALAYPAVAAYYGRPTTAAIWIAAIACYVLFQPQIDRAISKLPNPLNRD